MQSVSEKKKKKKNKTKEKVDYLPQFGRVLYSLPREMLQDVKGVRCGWQPGEYKPVLPGWGWGVGVGLGRGGGVARLCKLLFPGSFFFLTERVWRIVGMSPPPLTPTVY